MNNLSVLTAIAINYKFNLLTNRLQKETLDMEMLRIQLLILILQAPK